MKRTKVIIETVGSYSYIDPYTGENISHNKLSLVTRTPFIDGHIGAGTIKLLVPNLPETASADDFKKYMKECGKDKELLIASFASKFGLNQNGLPDGEAEKIKKSVQRIVKKAETAKLKEDK